MLWWDLRQLASKNPVTRLETAEKLGRSEDARAVRPLLALIHDEDSRVCAAAARSLVQLSKIGLTELQDSLRDPDPRVRWFALSTLGASGLEEAVLPIASELLDEQGFVRVEAAEALGHLASRTAVRPLLNATRDRDADVRVAACQALARIGEARAYPTVLEVFKQDLNDDQKKLLVRVLLSEDWKDLGTSLRARGAIEAQLWFTTLREEYWDPNLRAMASDVRKFLENLIQTEDNDGQIEHAAVEALSSPAPIMRDWGSRALLRHATAQAAEAMVAALADPKVSVRENLATGLIQLGLHARSALINALQREEPVIREAAIRVLGSLTDLHTQDALQQAVFDPEPTVRSAVIDAMVNSAHPQALEAAIAMINDQDQTVREAAVRAVAHLAAQGNAPAAERLSSIAADESAPDLAQIAGFAIQRISSRSASMEP